MGVAASDAELGELRVGKKIGYMGMWEGDKGRLEQQERLLPGLVRSR
jgi:hypothetical protein